MPRNALKARQQMKRMQQRFAQGVLADAERTHRMFMATLAALPLRARLVLAFSIILGRGRWPGAGDAQP